MRNFIKIILVSCWIVVFGGCNSWLDVQPYDSMTEDQLFSSEKGIEKALNGLYLDLASNDLYAKNMTCGAVDILAQRYYMHSEHTYYDLAEYKYTNSKPKSTFESIWKAAYKLIANCNEFIEQVPLHQEVLTTEKYRLMMGEALAVRTFMHFDLFRLFGPVYKEENLNKQSIPYYDQVTDVPMEILPAETLVKKLFADMDTAILLLKNDPVLTSGVVLGDEFNDYRNLRMNYYAAWALKARMCWYLGGEYKAQAFHIASSLLEGKDPETGVANNFPTTFKAVTEASAVKDRVYFPELLFAIHNMKRELVYKDLFTSDLDNNYVLWATQDFVRDLFRNTGSDNEYRRRWWETVSEDRGEYMAFVRFFPQEVNKATPYLYEVQSLLRLSELYLIAGMTTDDKELARHYLTELRLSRGHMNNNAMGYDVDELLDQEFQREFYGEGQYFFYLKRNQVKSLVTQAGTTVAMGNNYVIPLPESETNNRYE